MHIPIAERHITILRCLKPLKPAFTLPLIALVRTISIRALYWLIVAIDLKDVALVGFNVSFVFTQLGNQIAVLAPQLPRMTTFTTTLKGFIAKWRSYLDFTFSSYQYFVQPR